MNLLADKIRPNALEEVIGQEHLIGKNKVIYNLVNNKKIFSMILYGRPGIGKTTLAFVIANEIGKPYTFLNAAINKKEDFINAINTMDDDIILIIDEIHRMNKDKQDILLPYLENGKVILIGLTTSNPYMKVNPAIRSRVQIFELKELTKDNIIVGIKRAVNYLDGIKIDDDATCYIASLSCGDMRYALNLLEVASSINSHISLNLLKEINTSPNIYIDEDESGHYDLLSALQKSIRGSDPDASLFYLARLLKAGDLDSIERRLSVIVYEDIGLANPGIGPRLDSAINAAERVGLPEASIPLAYIVTEMALSPKSNSTYMGLSRAMDDVNLGLGGKIPDNITTHSKTYKYPHNYQNSYVKQDYLPKELIGKRYYLPKNNTVEKNLNKLFEDIKK